MTIVEVIEALRRDDPVGIAVTDAAYERPDPTIPYANPAFGRPTGRDWVEIFGLDQRFMQGRGTRRATLDGFHRTRLRVNASTVL